MGPAQGTAVLERIRTSLRGGTGGPYPLSPGSATPLPPLLNGTLRPGRQASSKSRPAGPKRSSGSRHELSCPPGNEPGTLCPAQSCKMESRGSLEVTLHVSASRAPGLPSSHLRAPLPSRPVTALEAQARAFCPSGTPIVTGGGSGQMRNLKGGCPEAGTCRHPPSLLRTSRTL